MSKSQKIINDALSAHAHLFERMDEIITCERAFEIFKGIADIPGPTLTAGHTRGPHLAQIIERAQVEGICGTGLDIDTNYLSSANVVISIGDASKKPIWSVAHLDNISYLTGEFRTGRYALTPFCDPRQTEGARPAHALIYDPASDRMVSVTDGLLIFDGSSHYFETEVPDLAPATRIVYSSAARWDRDSGIITGNVDNAFGCAALVLAAIVLANSNVQSLFVFTDEEEGTVAPGPAAFSRGASRLFNRIESENFPDLITITDHHEEVEALMQGTLDLSRFGRGALFGAFASGTKGGVTPPRLLASQREIARYLDSGGIQLYEHPGYISRSDCVSAMLVTANVSLIGYPCAYSHFIDTPRAHVDDLVNLAKTLVIMHLLAQNSTWRKAALG